MHIWLLLQDRDYVGAWTVLGAYGNQGAAEAALALLKAATTPGELKVEQRPIEA